MWKALGKDNWVVLGIWKMSEFFVHTLHACLLEEQRMPEQAKTSSFTWASCGTHPHPREANTTQLR